MSTYHERVAAAMKRSYSAGTMNSYETILEALLRKFPNEDDLRAYVEVLEYRLKLMGVMPKGMRFPDDALFDQFHDHDQGHG